MINKKQAIKLAEEFLNNGNKKNKKGKLYHHGIVLPLATTPNYINFSY